MAGENHDSSHVDVAKDWRDDWRIMGQEGYLYEQRLQHRQFDRTICIEDYDQCEFCWAVFDKDKDNPAIAYFCPSAHSWVCEECFRDFNKYFCWEVEEMVDYDNSEDGSTQST